MARKVGIGGEFSVTDYSLDPREKFFLWYVLSPDIDTPPITSRGMISIDRSDNGSFLYAAIIQLPDGDYNYNLTLQAMVKVTDITGFWLGDDPIEVWRCTNSTRTDGTFQFTNLNSNRFIIQNIVIYDPSFLPLDVPLFKGGFRNETRYSPQAAGLVPLWRAKPIVGPSGIGDPPVVNVEASGNWDDTPVVAVDTTGGFYSNFYWTERQFYYHDTLDPTGFERPSFAALKTGGTTVASGTLSTLALPRDGGWAIHYAQDFESPENGAVANTPVYTAYVLMGRQNPPQPRDFDANTVTSDSNDLIYTPTGCFIGTTFTNHVNNPDDYYSPDSIEWQYQIDEINQHWSKTGANSSFFLHLSENRNHTVRARTKGFVDNRSEFSNPEGAYSFFTPVHTPTVLYRELIPSGSTDSPFMVVKFTAPERFSEDDQGSSEYRIMRFENEVQVTSHPITSPTDVYAPVTDTDVISGFSAAIDYTWKYHFVDRNGDLSQPYILGLEDEKGIQTPTKKNYTYSRNVTVPADLSSRRRTAVAIEDLDLEKNVYVETGTVVSKVYQVPKGIYKVSLITTDVKPDGTNFDWIKYSISVDGGQWWYYLQPEHQPFDPEVPSVITFNSLLSADQRDLSAWGQRAFVDTKTVPTAIQLRAELSRKSDDPYASPQLLAYSLKVVERKNQFNLTQPEGFTKNTRFTQRADTPEL